MTVVDVGANIGVYAHGFLARGANVVAIEPQSEGAELIRAFYAAGFPRSSVRGKLDVRQEAVGDAEGKAVLHVPLRNGKQDAESATLEAKGDGESIDVEVIVRPLDAYGLDNVQIIKMDVEGHEIAALRGAARTIRRWKPDILVEIEQRHHSEPISDVFAKISEIVGPGYQFFFLGSDKTLKPLAEFDVEKQQLSLADNPLDPRYVRNFFIMSEPPRT
jgi:FkbM family methyltransferase